MCGIAGACRNGPFPDTETKVRKMLECLRHRGPDAFGIHCKGKGCIGNTLLKITGDLPQPLIGKYGALVFNGEIFNFREIAKSLGLQPRSDTETLLRLFEAEMEKNEDNHSNSRALNAVFAALSRVNGDYALAYLAGNELILARDPPGVKPLFYSFGKAKAAFPELFFASEKKAFLPLGIEAFSFSPGNILSFNINSGNLQEKSLQIQPPEFRITKEEEASFALKRALEKAVALRFVSGCGIAFSGGIDSALVAAFAKEKSQAQAFQLYAVGLSGSHDLLQAEFAARELGMEQKLVSHVLSPEEIEAVIPELIWTLETVDPLKIAIGLPLYIVAKEARKAGVRVLLTGQGSDELLAGYRRHEVFFEAGEDVLDREIFGDLCKISELNLERDDMVTMANGVELRVPFLDPEVIRVGLAISPELKVQKRNGAYIRKYILRKVARDLLSPELALKEKKAMQYGTGVQKVLDKLAREAGFSRKKGKHIEKYLGWVAEKKGFSF
ncbi:MAG: asparagine synthetase B [Methanosarcinaceae archaeon]|nr:asparagine synthetase B [Methanosarcinaceae archaeon]